MMQAIETQYKGYRFRSRLEARWAVFFDALRMDWEYEKEGYVLPGGTRYLPDFFIKIAPHWSDAVAHHGAGYWYEVKPSGTPTDDEMEKARWLCRETPHGVVIVTGDPGNFIPYKFHHSAYAPFVHTDDSGDYLWFVASQFLVMSDWVNGKEVRAAINASRGARFEHGETPAPYVSNRQRYETVKARLDELHGKKTGA